MEKQSSNDLLTKLGLPVDSLDDKTKFIKIVREGLPGKVVKLSVNILKNRPTLVRVLSVDSKNFHRVYQKKHLNRVDSEEMLDTIRVYRDAAKVFGSMEKAQEWMKTPIPALAGEKPEELFDTFEGRAWVNQALRKIGSGEFS